MKINTKFYNEIEVAEEKIFFFPQGLPGFPGERRFVYLQEEEGFFGCLQSVDNPEVAFIVITPYEVCPGYEIELDDTATEELELTAAEDALLLAIVTIPPGRPEDATVNLQAPLVLNTARHRGSQVI
ncbi:MAG TPA: flagellar assembly protein FliW, partial [Firmicutes bacterium]|nr:flagellar assembly protein FliW [Bacillota bacterium]